MKIINVTIWVVGIGFVLVVGWFFFGFGRLPDPWYGAYWLKPWPTVLVLLVWFAFILALFGIGHAIWENIRERILDWAARELGIRK